jgi:hypothetical protein
MLHLNQVVRAGTCKCNVSNEVSRLTTANAVLWKWYVTA